MQLKLITPSRVVFKMGTPILKKLFMVGIIWSEFGNTSAGNFAEGPKQTSETFAAVINAFVDQGGEDVDDQMWLHNTSFNEGPKLPKEAHVVLVDSYITDVTEAVNHYSQFRQYYARQGEGNCVSIWEIYLNL